MEMVNNLTKSNHLLKLVDLERRPLPTKIQMKRGRPRKDESDKQKVTTDVDSKKKKKEVPPAKLMNKTREI